MTRDTRDPQAGPATEAERSPRAGPATAADRPATAAGPATAADRPASLPVLLEAVLSVGSELELHSTLQHIVNSAAELCGARYGGGGGGGPPRGPGA
ncbi:hypothetical protein ACFWAO_12360, partial [Streptomyces sp. NPDC059981]